MVDKPPPANAPPPAKESVAPPPPPKPLAATDPQDVKVAITEADKKAQAASGEPWVGIREEQLARSREMEAMTVGKWVEAHDERLTAPPAPPAPATVAPPPPPKPKAA